MKRFTVAVYALFGTLALAAGLIAFVMPGVALPADEMTPLTSHLTRELSSAFVFIGLMFFWCIRTTTSAGRCTWRSWFHRAVCRRALEGLLATAAT